MALRAGSAPRRARPSRAIVGASARPSRAIVGASGRPARRRPRMIRAHVGAWTATVPMDLRAHVGAWTATVPMDLRAHVGAWTATVPMDLRAHVGAWIAGVANGCLGTPAAALKAAARAAWATRTASRTWPDR